MRDEATRGSEATYVLFAAFWALHVLFHYSSYASFFVSPLGLAAVVSAFFLLLRPSSPLRLAVSGYLYALAWFSHLPNAPNHEMIGSFVALTFTSAFLWERLRNGREFSAPRALALGAPVIRSIVLLMYFWTTFHKLNRDFLLDERVTCGAVFYRSFLERFTFLPEASGPLNLILAWGTVGVEAAIGILLLVPRLRAWGIALGWGFHLFLTLSPKSGFFNFTSLLFALFLLFAPATFAGRLAETWKESRLRALALKVMAADRWRAAPGVLVGVAMVGASLLLVTRQSISGLSQDLFDYFLQNNVAVRTEVFKLWMLWTLPLTYFVWRAYGRARGDGPELLGGVRAVPRPFWLITLIFFLWGATPYFGLKTESSMAMFSNLRTETLPNHYLVPAGLKIFDYQDDAVVVVRILGTRADGSRLPTHLFIRRRTVQVPYEGLRGWLRTQRRYGARIEEVAYRRNGELIVERPGDGGELFEQGLLVHKFLQFRRFRAKGPMTCEH